MDTIITIQGEQLTHLLREVDAARERDGLRTLRVAVDAGQFKVKVNEYTWSPPLGEANTGPY